MKLKKCVRERTNNFVRGYGYLNKTHDYYQVNEGSIVARIRTDDGVTIFRTSGDSDKVYQIHFDANTPEKILRGLSGMFEAELTDPLGLNPGESSDDDDLTLTSPRLPKFGKRFKYLR